MQRSQVVQGSVVAACLLAAFAAAGCGPRDTRIRNRVSGTVTYGGDPVAAGEILLIPDGAKGNSGPEGLAIIKDGRFDTRGSRAPGVDGGPMVIEVTGFLDEKRSRMITHSFQAELDRAPEMTLDIEINKKAATAFQVDPSL